jgi:hypothetical protein
VVSPNFIEGQYEFLCLPGQHTSYIFEEVADELSSEFYIGESSTYPETRLRRMPIELPAAEEEEEEEE